MQQPGPPGALAGLAGMPSGPLVTMMPGSMGGPPGASGNIPPTLPPNAPAPATPRSASPVAPPQSRPAPQFNQVQPMAYSPDVPPTLAPGTPSPLMPAPPTPRPQMQEQIPPTLPPANNSMVDANIPPTLPPNAQVPPQQNGAGMINCPRCGNATPSSFVYCQACGLHIGAIAPTNPDPQQQQRGKAPSTPQPVADPIGATIAAPQNQAANRPTTVAQTGPAWGTAVLVNRDGSDGERFPLTSDGVIIGRAGADIAFDEDRFLARQHVRLERGGDGGVKLHPMDTINGVFRKCDAPVELTDGMTILVGREVLRFEKVDAEERAIHPLVRHGVAVFGSPPREPWGRFLQLIPSGGHRDVRHLIADETVLGREEGDIVFRDDQFMSRRHAAVNWDGKRALLTDLGSSNGTFVRLAGPTPLKNRDHVRLGDQLLRIELAGR